MGQVAGGNFYVHLAGRTNGAHQSLVAKLQCVGHNQVSSLARCSYILVFCPVASRVGTDISEALDNMPGDKPVILVVMHHTFNRDHVVADSSRQVNHPNVRLTVDCLFYEGRLLESDRNEIAWFNIQTFLGVSASQISVFRKYYYLSRIHPWRTVLVCVGILTLTLKVFGLASSHGWGWRSG